MGKRAERTKRDLRCPICRSAIGQANCLICARRRQLTFPFNQGTFQYNNVSWTSGRCGRVSDRVPRDNYEWFRTGKLCYNFNITSKARIIQQKPWPYSVPCRFMNDWNTSAEDTSLAQTQTHLKTIWNCDSALCFWNFVSDLTRTGYFPFSSQV